MSSLSGIFGVIVAGRLTEFAQAGEAEFVTEIPNSAHSINHIVVFLTGVHPFPDGMGGSVYIRLLHQSIIGEWMYLGFISNDKPSAIFKLSQINKTALRGSEELFTHSAFNPGGGGAAQLGIMVESLDAIRARTPAEGTAPSHQSSMEEFTKRMLQNLFNHVQSFAVSMPRPDNPHAAAEYVPLAAMQQWYDTFQRRLSLNPNFWRTLS